MSFELATFAGGCFWCMVKPFDEQPGIEQVISGYTGGKTVNPTYEEVCSGGTGHTEAVQITYDPKKFTYKRLLDIFWMQIDPTDANGQFYDRGPSYRPVIFYHTLEQKELAELSKRELENSGKFSRPVVVPIEPAKPFYAAEDYHQHFYRKNPEHYHAYQTGSGRKNFINTYWGINNG